MKPLLISSGEPAGIGPDLCLSLKSYALPVVILCNKELLEQRARELNIEVKLVDYVKDKKLEFIPNQLIIYSLPCKVKVVAKQLDSRNAKYVIKMLTVAAKSCQDNEFSGVVTAPVHKGIINQAHIHFTGHTEFFAKFFQVDFVVMLLSCCSMRVALVTTHVPLKDVPKLITQDLIVNIVEKLSNGLKRDFSIVSPRIFVSGLNPHAGENGHLGREEIEVIIPAIKQLRAQNIDIFGPYSADTLFSKENAQKCDVFLAMYHDQGLTVLKYAGFGDAVNVTLGLPIIRTSVDHGTALDLAGTGKAKVDSLLKAVKLALKIIKSRALADEVKLLGDKI